jgi:hypothetical protein
MVYNVTDACLAGYAGSSVTKPSHTANDVLPQAVRAMATTLGSSLRGTYHRRGHLPPLHLNPRAKQPSSLELART